MKRKRWWKRKNEKWCKKKSETKKDWKNVCWFFVRKMKREKDFKRNFTMSLKKRFFHTQKRFFSNKKQRTVKKRKRKRNKSAKLMEKPHNTAWRCCLPRSVHFARSFSVLTTPERSSLSPHCLFRAACSLKTPVPACAHTYVCSSSCRTSADHVLLILELLYYEDQFTADRDDYFPCPVSMPSRRRYSHWPSTSNVTVLRVNILTKICMAQRKTILSVAWECFAQRHTRLPAFGKHALMMETWLSCTRHLPLNTNWLTRSNTHPSWGQDVSSSSKLGWTSTSHNSLAAVITCTADHVHHLVLAEHKGHRHFFPDRDWQNFSSCCLNTPFLTNSRCAERFNVRRVRAIFQEWRFAHREQKEWRRTISRETLE